MKNSAAVPSGAAEKRRLINFIRRSLVARHPGHCQASPRGLGSALVSSVGCGVSPRRTSFRLSADFEHPESPQIFEAEFLVRAESGHSSAAVKARKNLRFKPICRIFRSNHLIG